MLSSILLAAAALTGFVAAQNSSGDATTCYYSQSGPLAIDPNCIDPSLRGTWCNSQSTICPMLCSNGQTAAGGNTCDPNTLNYTCTCASGNQPNVSAYENTMAWHVCQSWVQYCVAGNPDDLDAITACRSVQCGTLNASEASSGSATTSASGSSSTTSSGSGSSDTATASTSGSASASSSGAAAATSTGAAAALSVGMQYGTGILGAGLLALFGLAL